MSYTAAPPLASLLAAGRVFDQFVTANPLQQLQSARKVWDQQNIDDYTMTVGFSTMNNIGRYNFVVQDNVPMSVAVWSSLELQPIPEALQNIESIELETYGGFPKKLVDYTIDGLFDYAAQKLADQPMTPLITMCGITQGHPAEVTFDESLGYIKSLTYDDCGHWNVGGGLLCGGMADCFAGIRILDFKPLQ